jgi:DNA-binding Lrp family transcriptional regulator
VDSIDQELMYQLQRDFPLAVRPFAVLAERLQITEADALARTQRFFDEGKARRFGAVFDARGLGYKSALCGVAVPESELEAVAAKICPHVGVTHCYTRAWPVALDRSLVGCPTQVLPNLWFTLAAQGDQFENELAKMQAGFPYPILALPALKRFKIDVVFDPRAEKSMKQSKPARMASAAIVPSEIEQEIIRRLQQNLAVVAQPFAEIAKAVGMDETALVELLQNWKELGVLRRVALILFHHKIGFKANAMCVWDVPAERVAEVGKVLATRPEITHCYERARSAEFPFNVYAMIHRSTWAEIHALFMELSEQVGDYPGNMLGSMREFKKASPYYFGE